MYGCIHGEGRSIIIYSHFAHHHHHHRPLNTYQRWHTANKDCISHMYHTGGRLLVRLLHTAVRPLTAGWRHTVGWQAGYLPVGTRHWYCRATIWRRRRGVAPAAVIPATAHVNNVNAPARVPHGQRHQWRHQQQMSSARAFVVPSVQWLGCTVILGAKVIRVATVLQVAGIAVIVWLVVAGCTGHNKRSFTQVIAGMVQ